MVETTMEINDWLRKQIEQASPDLLREMVREFAQALMGAEVDAICGADYGERSPERVNIRTATASGPGTRALGRSSSPSRSCGLTQDGLHNTELE